MQKGRSAKSAKTCLDIVLFSKMFGPKRVFFDPAAAFTENTLMIQVPYGRIFQYADNGYDAYIKKLLALGKAAIEANDLHSRYVVH